MFPFQLQDIKTLKTEVGRWKEEVKEQEKKSAIAASRLKEEVDAHRVTREQLDATIKHLSETRLDIDKTRKECTEFMENLRNDEEAKQKKEKEAEKEKSAKLIIDAVAATELETTRENYAKLVEEHKCLTEKLEKLEQSREEQRQTLIRETETVNAQKQEIDELLSQMAELER